jgi:hypothetical protein
MATRAPLVLSEQLRLPVFTRGGCRLGRVADLTVQLGQARPAVHRFLVRTSRSTGFLVTWSDVVEFSPSGIVLDTNADAVPVDPRRPGLEPGEVLLARDVMDTPVVDLRGHRLSRVSDVLLIRTGTALGVVGVDLGAAGLLRRMGLGRLVRQRPLLAVDWSDLHLTSRRGHLVQLSTSAASFHRLDARELAELPARGTERP